MKTPQKRTLTITCADGDEVTKKQLTCFVHNLAADQQRETPLIRWYKDSAAGAHAFYTNGLSAGSRITLSMDDTHTVHMSYSKHGKLIYTAIEHDGDRKNSDHLTHLYYLTEKTAVNGDYFEFDETPPAPAPDKPEKGKKTLSKADSRRHYTTVAEMFRKVTADQIVDRILRKPSMLSINIAVGSPSYTRVETLIRSVVGYIQAARPTSTRYLLKGFALMSLTGDRRVCGHLMLSPMADIANAYVELDDKYYGGLKPTEKTEKFVADIVINMLIGI